jgi:GNAT superfamily N-acetyltransferase
LKATILHIRPAHATDPDQISALIMSLAYLFLASPDRTGSEQFKKAITPQAMALYMARPDVHYLIAEEDGVFCGAVGLRENRHLHHLFVVPAFHRRGVGRQLWQAVRDEALAAGNPGEFTVKASLNAVPVYQRFGFKSVGGPQQANGLVFQPMKLVDAQGAALSVSPRP